MLQHKNAKEQLRLTSPATHWTDGDVSSLSDEIMLSKRKEQYYDPEHRGVERGQTVLFSVEKTF